MGTRSAIDIHVHKALALTLRISQDTAAAPVARGRRIMHEKIKCICSKLQTKKAPRGSKV